uniref:hypothetical protein n=1 Tax=Enterobacter roggenkampii TaxID=1812935 RepID=UPI0022DEFBBF
ALSEHKTLSVSWSHYHGDEYYSYTITDTGIDKLLEHEELLSKRAPKAKTNTAPLDFSDDIPF